MNSLSWMIYLAGVSSSLKPCFVIAAFFSFAFILAWPIRNGWLEDFNGGEGVTPVPLKILLSLGAGFALAACFVPSSNTVYAIAASEMGEKALNTPTATKAMKALDAWLDKQIAPEKETAK